MGDNDAMVGNVIILSNVSEVVKMALTKVGLEYIPPVDSSEIEEIISKTINEEVCK